MTTRIDEKANGTRLLSGDIDPFACFKLCLFDTDGEKKLGEVEFRPHGLWMFGIALSHLLQNVGIADARPKITIEPQNQK